MTTFHEFLTERLAGGGFSTEDALASFLPLVRETLEAHAADRVAPLEGLDDLRVEGVRIWFEEAQRRPLRRNAGMVRRIQAHDLSGVEIVSETRRTAAIDEAQERTVNLAISDRGEPVVRPVYLPGYVAWEHEIEHHDPLTDIYSLGLILASLACGLDFTKPDDLEQFAAARDNLFRIQPDLHPVLARAIAKMTEIDRHRRAQDLAALLKTLENYRDQEIDFDFDLARIQGLREKDSQTRQSVVLTKLRERLFELSRRNRLLHFRATMQSVNLTQSSVPLSFDVKNVRPDQILVWSDATQRGFLTGMPVSLNKFLNFAEAIYLPGVLDRIIAEARRDLAEYGFAQLRLVVCFLHWANLKDKPVEQFDSPLVLLPVKLTKKKGIRDTFLLEVLESEAEINPVVRHQFKQLYAIDLPDRIDLTKTSLDDFFLYLAKTIEASDVAVTLKKIDRPRISLIHERAKRRLDQYRRKARLAGRGVRKFLDLDYSYDPANYHPLGIKLFSAKVRTPTTNLRSVVEETPRPRTFMAPPAAADDSVKERSFYSMHEGGEENPYNWTFDLCSVTLANFKYRKMSLVRDYDSLLADGPVNDAFESIFSLAPRPVERELPTVPSLDERFDVVPCDPTQAAAIEEAHTGKSYIIQGPPGTGKSQTITNLIADYVARGRRVLFVCEKRAAIDVVFARLRQCGLADLCCLIHDSQTDKKEFVMDLKQTYEGCLQEETLKTRRVRRKTVLKRMKAELAPLELFDDGMTQPLAAAGMPLRKLIDQCLELGEYLPELSPAAAERLPDYASWHRARGSIGRYSSALARVQPDGVASRHPLSIVSPRLVEADRPIEIVASATEAAAVHLADLKKSLGACGVPANQWDCLARASELIVYAQKIQPVTALGLATLLDAKSESAERFKSRMADLEQRQQALADAAGKTTAWRERLPAAEVDVALQQALSFEGKFFAWLSPAWWRLRGILRRCYDFSSHVVKPSWRHVLEGLRDEYARQAESERYAADMSREFGTPADVAGFSEMLTRLREEFRGLPDWIARIHAAITKSPKAQQIVDRIVSANEACTDLQSELARFADNVDDRPLDELGDAIAAATDSMEDLPDYLAALGELATVPDDVSRVLRTLPHSPTVLKAATAHRSLSQCYRQSRDLERLTGNQLARHAAALEQQYDRWLTANAGDLRRTVERRFLKNIHLCNQPTGQLSPDEKELKKRYNRGRRELEHEFGKSMRYKPIRELVSGDSGEVVKDLKPVWLMSPLSVSDTLPLDARHFDVVIFDEASQITLEEAVPSIFRAGQSIVVGDEMQLPPTDFFSARRSDEEDELTIEEEDELVQYDLESNSFLNHAAKNLPATMLGWHYRSRSESLISFSNWMFYDGRLLTVPEEEIANLTRPPIVASDCGEAASGADALLDRAVSFHFLEHGVYENRRNRAEAEYIAGMVRRLIDAGDGRTIGVVAFSEAQQGEIEAALARLAVEDGTFARRLEAEYEREEDGQFVGLLVKNLENIQGDERDIIILSVCYACDSHGKMRMNFGPINKSGGEKRLNVAFSRAKHHMALVSSITHVDITNDYNDGANCLKQYLRYAAAVSTGDAPSATSVLHGMSRWLEPGQRQPSRSVLTGQIAAALAQRGFIVEEQIGQSHFRCDLAVRQEGDAAYRLGILLDTDDHYEQSDLLERDMMRPRLLRAFGWRVTHVLAKDWQADRVEELARLVRLLAGEDDERLVTAAADADDDELDDDDTVAEEVPAGGSTANDALSDDGRLCHYFEFKDDRSSKFWEITLDGDSHTVRFGRIGTAGQSLTKSFPDHESARFDCDRLIREKMAKGYTAQDEA